MLLLVDVLDYLIYALVLWFFVTQIAWPYLIDRPLFPLFRRRPIVETSGPTHVVPWPPPIAPVSPPPPPPLAAPTTPTDLSVGGDSHDDHAA